MNSGGARGAVPTDAAVPAETAVASETAAMATAESAAVTAGRGVSAAMLRQNRLGRNLDEEDQKDERREGTKATHGCIISLFSRGVRRIS